MSAESKCDLFVFVGEKSADLHGERLLRALKEKHPDLRIAGVGGPRMRALGMHSILEMEQFQVMGFVDVFLSLPSLIRHFYTVAKAIQHMHPKCVLTIDYPGFNLRLARHLRKKNYRGKICHYICPSVWAWGKKRIPLMAKTLDLLLTILPFEKKLFASTPLHVEYVGHPLVEKLRTYLYKPLPFYTDKKIIALFPGSRKKEIERNLKLHLQVCKNIPDAHLVISLSDAKYGPLIESIMRAEGMDYGPNFTLLSSDYNYELMRAAHIAIAKSGTVTLELALQRTPTVVTYGIGKLDLFIARDLLRIRLPFYCLVNIIAEKQVFKELIGPAFTQEALRAEVQQLLAQEKQDEIKAKCDEVIALLGQKNAAEEAAQHISQLLS